MKHTENKKFWLLRNLHLNDNDVRFYGHFTPNFYELQLDFCKGLSQIPPNKIPPIELVIPKIQTGKMYDNISVPPNFGILVSNKLKEVFDTAGVENIQWYKTLITNSNNKLISNQYYLGNIIGTANAVDFQLSELILDEDDGTIDFIDKLVLKGDLQLQSSIFRPNEFLPLEVITNDLKKAIESLNCTGIKFIEPEKLKL